MSTTHQQTFDFILRSGLAGGTAGCVVSKTVVAPLDRVKILFQASNPDFQTYAGTWRGAYNAGSQIYRTAGVWGLFQGHSATLLRVFPYAAVNFMAYVQARHLLMPTKERETNPRRFAAGAFSGMVSVFFTYPLELVRVRMAFQTRAPTSTATSAAPRPSFPRACAQVSRESTDAIPSHAPAQQAPKAASPFMRYPLLKFYRGFFVTMVGMIPYAGISFLSWEFLRARYVPHRLGRDGKARPTPLPDLAIAALSGVLAQTASCPLEVVRRRMQVGGLTCPERWLGVWECMLEVWAGGVRTYERAHPGAGTGWGAWVAGVRGFYVGLGVGYLKMVPMTAVSFAAWQGMKRVLGI